MTEIPNITSEDVKAAMADAGTTRILHHECSMCGYPCAYEVLDGGEVVVFDAGCHCTGRHDLRPSGFDAIAAWHNMQTMDKHRTSIRTAVGLQ